MKESLYLQYVMAYFPTLVTEVVERLNDRRRNVMPYMFRDLLTPVFSADGKWASVLADYNRVAADVVALDSELPLKSRDSLTTVSGNIPKLGMKLYLTEQDHKTIDSMIAQYQANATAMPIGLVIERIFNDLPRVIEGIYERIEDIFLSELSSGVGLSEKNNGTGVRVDVGYYDENKKGVAVVWNGNPTTSTPLDDIQAIVDKAVDDGNTITDVWLDDYALKALYLSTQMRGQFAFNQGISTTSGSNVPNLDLDKVSSVFQAQWGITPHRVSRKIKTELNGIKTTHSPWAEGQVVFTCDETLGSLVWTNVVEATRRVSGVQYQIVDTYMLVKKYSTTDPFREFTASEAMVVPILNNVDRIYVLDTKTQQA